MDRTVAEILRELGAPQAADVTVSELSKSDLSPKAVIAFEQMRARGEKKQYAARYGTHSTTISLSQRAALMRQGATEV